MKSSFPVPLIWRREGRADSLLTPTQPKVCITRVTGLLWTQTLETGLISGHRDSRVGWIVAQGGGWQVQRVGVTVSGRKTKQRWWKEGRN